MGPFMFTIGLAKMGTLARYIPFPVMGGFLQGLDICLQKVVSQLQPDLWSTPPAS